MKSKVKKQSDSRCKLGEHLKTSIQFDKRCAYMLNNIVGCPGYQFHLEEPKLVMNGVQLVHNSLHAFVFLSVNVNTVQREQSKLPTSMIS